MPAWNGPDPEGTVLVTGGTGFIGTATVRALLDARRRERRAPRVHVLARGPLPQWMTDAGVVRVPGDLTAPHSLRGVCDGVSTVLHLASEVRRDPDLCTAVNVHGTASLVREAAAARVRRLVYNGTAAVYGNGPHTGGCTRALSPAPASAASRTRLQAERTVRAFGGMVLRPNLVYGVGDRWFVPALLRLFDRVPALPDGGSARISVIAVEDLARVLAALVVGSAAPAGSAAIGTYGAAADDGDGDRGAGTASEPDPERGSVHHANHPQPVRLRDLVRTACAAIGLAPPREDLPLDEFRRRVREVRPDITDHQLSMVALDNWYTSDQIWRRLGLDPGPGIAGRFAACASWYRQHLSG